MKTETIDQLTDIVLDHLRSLPPATLRPSILFHLLVLAGVLKSMDDMPRYVSNPAQMVDAAEKLFVPTESCDLELFQHGALIRVCAMIDHVYLARSKADAKTTAAAVAELGRPDIALRIPLEGAQLEKAAAEWRSLRQTTLSPDNLVDAVPSPDLPSG